MEGQKVLRSKTTSEPKTFYSFHRCFYMNYSILPYIKKFLGYLVYFVILSYNVCFIYFSRSEGTMPTLSQLPTVLLHAQIDLLEDARH